MTRLNSAKLINLDHAYPPHGLTLILGQVAFLVDVELVEEVEGNDGVDVDHHASHCQGHHQLHA